MSIPIETRPGAITEVTPPVGKRFHIEHVSAQTGERAQVGLIASFGAANVRFAIFD